MLFDEMGDREQIQFWLEAVGKEKLGEGIRIGEERGIRIGEARMQKMQTDMIRTMLQEGLEDSEILTITGVTPEYLASLKVQFAKTEKQLNALHGRAFLRSGMPGENDLCISTAHPVRNAYNEHRALSAQE